MQLHVNNCSDIKVQFTVLVATLYTAYIRSSLYLLPELHLSSGLLTKLTYWMMFLLFSKYSWIQYRTSGTKFLELTQAHSNVYSKVI